MNYLTKLMVIRLFDIWIHKAYVCHLWPIEMVSGEESALAFAWHSAFTEVVNKLGHWIDSLFSQPSLRSLTHFCFDSVALPLETPPSSLCFKNPFH